MLTDAVILMAGAGSRLRGSGKGLPKPLVPIRGRPLISYTLDVLVAVGIRTLHAVVGCERELLLDGLRALMPTDIRLHPIDNREWQKQNGVSLLCAARHLSEPFLLLMGDHLFEPQLLGDFVRRAVPGELNLAIDRKVSSIVDLADAMKVQTRDGRVIAMGKELKSYDAIDTGIFVCSLEIFSYLEAAQKNGDCSLADGVRLMAADDKVGAIDIGEAWWQDVDDLRMLDRAEAIASRLTNALRADERSERE